MRTPHILWDSRRSWRTNGANATQSAFCPGGNFKDRITELLTGQASVSTSYDWWNIESGFWESLKESPYADEGATTLNESTSALRMIGNTNLSQVVGGFTASLTKLALDLSKKTVSGNVTTSRVYVQVEWRSIILPGVLEMVGIVLLPATVLVSRCGHVPLWKPSLLPVLYRGLE